MINFADMNWWELPHWKWRNDRDENGTKEEIDYQRQRAYAAEQISGVKTAPQRQFDTIEQCQDYVNEVCSTAYFKRRFGDFEVTAVYKMSGSALGARQSNTRGKIWLPRWAFREWVILHELSHCLTPEASGGGHGRRWCRTYLDLVGFHLGRLWEKRLRESFIAKAVKTTPKRPGNVISPQCAAVRDQYYTKSLTPQQAPAPDVFPEFTEDVCLWVEKHYNWGKGSVRMRRVLTPGFFEFTHAPGLTHPFPVNVYRLADLNLGEWLDAFKAEYDKNQSNA